MNKRYQVFVSSTYADLKEERQSVIQTLIEMDCIPAGMELFPAADQEQLEFIKRVIDDCDYYLLIIGGRYGSVTETGISYTEQEYEYAVASGLKVIALIHENPEEIPLGKSEIDPLLREKLQNFRDKVAENRLVKFWNTAEELPGLVALGLSKTMKLFPAVGWIRATGAANAEVLSEINELRKKNAYLEASLAEAALTNSDEVPGFDMVMVIRGYYRTFQGYFENWKVTTRIRAIFSQLAPHLLTPRSDAQVKTILTRELFADAEYKTVADQDPHAGLEEPWSDTIVATLKELGLIESENREADKPERWWFLTPQGKRTLIQVGTVRSHAVAATSR